MYEYELHSDGTMSIFKVDKDGDGSILLGIVPFPHTLTVLDRLRSAKNLRAFRYVLMNAIKQFCNSQKGEK